MINNTIEEINSNNLHDLKVSFNYIYDNDFLKKQLMQLLVDGSLKLNEAFNSYLKNCFNLEKVEKDVQPKYFGTFFVKEIYSFNDKIYCGYDSSYFDTDKLESVCQLYILGRTGCGKSSSIAEISKKYPLVFIDLNNNQYFRV